MSVVHAAAARLPRLPPGIAAARAFAPSLRSVAAGLVLLAAAGGGYAAARETSMFAVTHIYVRGAPPGVRAKVLRELAPFRGVSLLALDGSSLERRVGSLPTVEAVSYDRAFPHTLRITVVAERPVAVLHRGKQTWIVSARGRVIHSIRPLTRPGLPRIWLPTAAPVVDGDVLQAYAGGIAARAAAVAAHFPARIETVSLVKGELAFQLHSGIALLLGDPTDLRLKLAVARRALPVLPAGSTYLDVSVPGRPVAGTNTQVSGGG